MFGKGLIKIIGLAVGGAIALAAGAQVLSSVVSIVLAFRLGNIIPLLLAIVLTLSILLIANRVHEESTARVIIKVLSYAATGYLAVIAFVIVLPYGLIVSTIAAGAVGFFSSILGENKKFSDQFKNTFSFQSNFKRLASKSVAIGDGASYRLNPSHTIVILEEGNRERILHLMKERPLLPISLTHYEDCDVLFIAEENEPSRYERVLKLLKDESIGLKGPVSPLLAETIQMFPILDSINGLKFEDYRVARDDSTISSLLVNPPPRLTVFSSIQGLRVLVPELEAPGLNVKRLKQGYEADILLHRNYSCLEEVERQIESTARDL